MEKKNWNQKVKIIKKNYKHPESHEPYMRSSMLDIDICEARKCLYMEWRDINRNVHYQAGKISCHKHHD